MSRPRTPFGADLPGRLPATMLKVLAAEMSDAGRLARGKRYWSEQAVIDIVVGHGAVTAEVQGSRPQPYVVTLEARPGRGAPGRADVRARCTCPDDDGIGRTACKHAVAALFVLADEVAIEPEVLARWRRSDVADRADLDDGDVADPDVADQPVVRGRGTLARALPDPGDAEPDRPLAALLDPPPGVALPELPPITPLPPVPVADPVVADVLADAVAHLALHWE